MNEKKLDKTPLKLIMSDKQIDPLNPTIPPEILKTDEYRMMCRLIDKGLWRTGNLSRALNIDLETVAIWKKTDTIQRIYRQTVLKFISKRKDEESILRELGVESDPSKSELTIKVIPLLGGATRAISGNEGNSQITETIKED